MAKLKVTGIAIHTDYSLEPTGSDTTLRLVSWNICMAP